jgi:hypothetical protein
MRVLLLHPEDVPSLGPWSKQSWDVILDLGRSSQFSEKQWSAQQGCTVLRTEAFRDDFSNIRRVRDFLSAGLGRVIDEEGLDWWQLIYLRAVPELLTILTLQRAIQHVVVGRIKVDGELWCTRESWQANVFAALCDRSLHCFGSDRRSRAIAQLKRPADLFRRLSWPQIKQIIFDKYDAGYQWRSRFASRPKPSSEPVVLIPSAYENVSRMAVDYARLIPEQRFLLIATRWSGKQFLPAANVEVRDLAAYGGEYPRAEIASVLERWRRLKKDLGSAPEFRMLQRTGILESIPAWFSDGLCARNAWREAIEREPVSGVLCGDDSNMYTRLPVLLAAKRKISTVDFHHGALDGHCMIKDQPSDVYFAKSEMEHDYLVRVCGRAADRIAIAAPARHSVRSLPHDERDHASAVILFSEPYETGEMRGEEVYREILSPLIRVARDNGRRVIVKLHPFESKAQRERMIRHLFPAEDRKRITVLDGPLNAKILSQAWFGITVESSTAMNCWENGTPCFLCGWLALSPYGYLQQYARFGIGEELQSAEQIAQIPQRLLNMKRPHAGEAESTIIDPASLKRLLTCGMRDGHGVRSAS